MGVNGIVGLDRARSRIRTHTGHQYRIKEHSNYDDGFAHRLRDVATFVAFFAIRPGPSTLCHLDGNA